ncbi:MAG: hypothetical protein NZ739_12160, partial [Verrucomicrobiae bacterium]|nr:hypothetical protein [Verrucomicrobiae bacterium]
RAGIFVSSLGDRNWPADLHQVESIGRTAGYFGPVVAGFSNSLVWLLPAFPVYLVAVFNGFRPRNSNLLMGILDDCFKDGRRA